MRTRTHVKPRASDSAHLQNHPENAPDRDAPALSKMHYNGRRAGTYPCPVRPTPRIPCADVKEDPHGCRVRLQERVSRLLRAEGEAGAHRRGPDDVSRSRRARATRTRRAARTQQALEALYALSFTIKMAKKGDWQPEGYFDYVVPPLEGLWWGGGFDGARVADKGALRWVSLIRQPDFVTPEVLAWAAERVAAKKPGADVGRVRLVRFAEGPCAQIMHRGPYDDEPATVAALGGVRRRIGARGATSPSPTSDEALLTALDAHGGGARRAAASRDIPGRPPPHEAGKPPHRGAPPRSPRVERAGRGVAASSTPSLRRSGRQDPPADARCGIRPRGDEHRLSYSRK